MDENNELVFGDSSGELLMEDMQGALSYEGDDLSLEEDDPVLGELELSDSGDDLLDLGASAAEGIQQDIAELCWAYHRATINLLTQAGGKKNQSLDDIVMSTLKRDSIPGLNDTEFMAASKAICETCDELKDEPEDRALEHVVHALINSCRWSVGEEAHKVYPAIRAAIKNCRAAVKVPLVKTAFSVFDKLDLEDLRGQSKLMLETAKPFHAATVGVKDENLDPLAKISSKGLGRWVTAAIAELNYPSQLTVSRATELVFAIIQRPEVYTSVGLQEEDTRTLSLGELLRRVTLKDLENGTLTYTVMTSVKDINDVVRFYAELASCSESVAGSLLDLWFRIAVAGNPRAESTSDFLWGTMEYLSMFRADPRRLRIAVYGSAKLLQDGKFQLSYAIDGSVRSVVTDSLLCKVYGDTSSYKIPIAEFDSANGCIVLPPLELYKHILARPEIMKTRLPANSVYWWEPTTTFAKNSGIFVEPSDATDSVFEESTEIDDSETLAILREYHAEFENDLDQTQEERVTLNLSDGRKLYGVRTDENTATISLIEDNGLLTVLSAGTLLMSDTEPLVFSYRDERNVPKNELIKQGEYEEDVIHQTDGQSADGLVMSDYYSDRRRGSASYVANQNFATAVRTLCELATVDYERGLERIRNIASRCFVNVLGMHRLYGLVGSKIIEQFFGVVENTVPPQVEESTGIIEGVNFDALQDVLQFTVGDNKLLEGKKTMTREDIPAIRSYLEENADTVDSILESLQQVNMDALAMQIISHSQPKDTGDEAQLYDVFRAIPELSGWVYEFEHRMLLADILAQLGDAVLSFVSIDGTFGGIARAGIESAAAAMPAIKAKLSEGVTKCELVEYTQKWMSYTERAPSPTCKCAIIDGDLYGTIVGLLEGVPLGEGTDKLPAEVKEFLNSFESLRGLDVREMNHAAFNSKCPRAKQMELFDSQRPFFTHLIEGSVLTRLTTEQQSVAVVYQLIRNYYARMLDNIFLRVAADGEDVDESSQSFYDFAMSVFAAYAPVFGESLVRIGTGDSRVEAFMSGPRMFCVPASMVKAKEESGFELQDIVDFIPASV